MKRVKGLSRFAIGTCLILLLSACAAEPPRQRVFWPPLPDRPRFEWIKNYYSQDDFPKTASQRVLEETLGKPPLLFFGQPVGIAARGDRGIVYVSDADLREVRYYDLKNYSIHRLNAVTTFGQPSGMTIDARGNLYVCDNRQSKVHVFGPDNQPLFNIGNAEIFQVPAYVEVNDRLGRVYVSDGAGWRVHVFDLAGKHLFSFGKPGGGGGPGEFRAPQGLAIDKQDRVFVADQLNARIQVFDADGNFLYAFGQRSDQITGFEGPKDLAFDSEGNLHILDIRKSALITYTPEGKLLLFTGGGASASPVGFALPAGIWIDKDDRIYVADSFNARFSVWQYLSERYLRENPIP